MNKINKSTAAQMIIASTLLTLFIPILSFSQNVSYQNTVYKQQNPILFEIVKDGKISHILGSMHAGIPIDSYPDIIFQLANKSKSMAFEADYDKAVNTVRPPKIQTPDDEKKINQFLSKNAIQKIKDIYEDEASKVLSQLTAADVLADLSNHYRNYVDKNFDKKLMNIKYGIDNHLDQHAKIKNKKIIYIDNVEKMLNEPKIESDQQLLERLLSYPDTLNVGINCFLMSQNYYMLGDMTGLKSLNDKCTSKTILKGVPERNIEWIPKLEPLLQKGGAFITVGADHITGPNGLESLLKAKGYSVKRIGGTPANNQRPIYGYGDSLGEPERKFIESGSNQ